jgi:hypothetical protein
MARYDDTLVLPSADLRGSNCRTCSGRFLDFSDMPAGMPDVCYRGKSGRDLKFADGRKGLI